MPYQLHCWPLAELELLEEATIDEELDEGILEELELITLEETLLEELLMLEETLLDELPVPEQMAP